MQVTVTYLVVGLIVGFAIGLGAGWFFWHGRTAVEEKEPERPGRRPARYPRSYEPSTPPQHRPTPRPRPVTALHPPNPILPEVDVTSRRETAAPPVGDAPAPPAAVTAPEPAVTPAGGTDSEPRHEYEYRPGPAPEKQAVPVDQQPPDRQLLHNLLETNRRLTEDAELRLRREGAGSRQLDLGERPLARPRVAAPEDNDLLARHRKLEEDSRRMSRRAD